MKNMDTIDKAAMLVSTGLMFLSIVVLGVIEIIDGPPYGGTPMKNEAGEIVATPGVDPAIRTGLFVLGLLVLLVWAVYKLVGADVSDEAVGTETPTQ